MPVIIHSHEIHPFLPSLGSPLAIDRSRAEQQDIRPLEVAIINLMADKISTERQLALWLGNTMLQVNLTFVATDSYVRGVAAGRHTRNTPADHIRKFYSAFTDIRHQKFDGFVVTGVNALSPRVEQEPFWPEVADILQWTTTHAFSCLFLCWGAKAALKFFHDIDSHKGERKLFGLFEHRLISDKTGLLFGFPDIFPAPVSRWKSPKREDILKVPALEIVADSEEAGPNILVESEPLDDNSGLFPRRVYILNHPEYETDTLGVEYHRDRANDPDYPLPRHYFPEDDPSRAAPNLWRHMAYIYTNWVKAVYESTPYAIEAIPNPSKIAEGVQAGAPRSSDRRGCPRSPPRWRRLLLRRLSYGRSSSGSVKTMIDDRQYAPATLRNRDFILDVLRDLLPMTGVILESEVARARMSSISLPAPCNSRRI